MFLPFGFLEWIYVTSSLQQRIIMKQCIARIAHWLQASNWFSLQLERTARKGLDRGLCFTVSHHGHRNIIPSFHASILARKL